MQRVSITVQMGIFQKTFWVKWRKNPTNQARMRGMWGGTYQQYKVFTSSPPPRKPGVQTLSETGFLPSASLKWLRGAGGGPQGSKLDLFRHPPHLTVCNHLPLLSVSILQGCYLLFGFLDKISGSPGLLQICCLWLWP